MEGFILQRALKLIENNSLPESIKDLVSRKNILDEALDEIANNLVNFSVQQSDNFDDENTVNLEYRALATAEHKIASKWNETLEAIFQFVPNDSFEYGLKISTLALEIKRGSENPRFLEIIIREAQFMMDLQSERHDSYE